MILVLYLLKSTLVMGLLLLFYRTFLEKEKMHVFNRFFLLFAIMLSIIIPLLPTGMVMSVQEIQPMIEAIPSSETLISQTATDSNEQSFTIPIYLIVAIYIGMFLYFSMRFGRNIFSLLKKVRSNESQFYKGAKLVLLDDCNSPFTFWNYIFLHRKAYENNNVDKQLLDHELTHAKQRHSWDILFVEFVMLIFWFNPILRWYKTSIQLNHEFLADDSVIEKYKEVKTYQYLLLDTIQNNNTIYLASNINFHLTQKRLKMMTKKSSSRRKKVLIFSLLPIILVLLIGLGNPTIILGQNDLKYQEIEKERELQEEMRMFKDIYFEHAMVYYKTKDGKTKVISYKSLDDEMKSVIPMPPPPPPALPGTVQKEKEVEQLPKGSVIYIESNGSIRIASKNGELVMPPSPPAPVSPKAVEKTKSGSLPFPPKPTMPPKPVKSVKPVKGGNNIQAPAPPAPPVPPMPPSFDDLAEDGADFFIDGKKVSLIKARKLWDDTGDALKCIDLKNGDNGKMSVHMTKN